MVDVVFLRVSGVGRPNTAAYAPPSKAGTCCKRRGRGERVCAPRIPHPPSPSSVPSSISISLCLIQNVPTLCVLPVFVIFPSLAPMCKHITTSEGRLCIPFEICEKRPFQKCIGWWGGAAQPASGGGCLPQPRWAICATGAGAHQGQTSREGERGIWWTARTARDGRHLGRTETQRGRRWTACGQRCVDSKNSQTTPTTTSTSSIRQLLGAADTQTAHHAASSTVPTRQLLGSANAETTPARAPATAADRK